MQKVEKNILATSDQYIQRQKISNSAKFKGAKIKKGRKKNKGKTSNDSRENLKKKLREIQQKMKSETLKKGKSGIEINDVEQKRLFDEGKRIRILLEGWNKSKKNKHKSK